MATSQETYNVFKDIVNETRANQSVVQRKANTVTTAVGVVLTALVAGVAYIAEQGAGGNDSWIALVAGAVPLIGTAFGVNFTKNGITDSVQQQLNDTLNKRIDNHHQDDAGFVLQGSNVVPAQQPDQGFAAPVAPTSVAGSQQTNPDDLLNEAKRLSGG